MIVLRKTILDETEVLYAFWQKETLVVGVGTHTLYFDEADDAERVWELLGGKETPPEGKWREE